MLSRKEFLRMKEQCHEVQKKQIYGYPSKWGIEFSVNTAHCKNQLSCLAGGFSDPFAKIDINLFPKPLSPCKGTSCLNLF